MKKQIVSFAVQTDKQGTIQKIGRSVIEQPKVNFKGGSFKSVKWFDDSLLVRYIYREEGESVIKTKQAWLEWFEHNGDKENFASAESWFYEWSRCRFYARFQRLGSDG